MQHIVIKLENGFHFKKAREVISKFGGTHKKGRYFLHTTTKYLPPPLSVNFNALSMLDRICLALSIRTIM